MIITLTLNPAVDKTIRLPSLAPGGVHRVSESQLDPAGKGLNVSRLVDRLGWPTIAFGFLGGEIGRLAAQAIQEEGVLGHFLAVAGQTRLNVTVFDEARGEGTSFYDEGPRVDPERVDALERDLSPWLGACRVLVLAGSLPPRVPDDVYARFIQLAHSSGARTILDAEGEPLRLGARARPYLIKPNRREFEGLVGRRLPERDDVVAAAREVAAEGVEVVVVSLGSEGAICVRGGESWLIVPPRIERRSTVGSGDSMVAGLALGLARGDDLTEGLRLGTAAGAATAASPGTALGDPDEIARLLPLVRVEPLGSALGE